MEVIVIFDWNIIISLQILIITIMIFTCIYVINGVEKRKIGLHNVKKINKINNNYFDKLNIEDFEAFEKYRVWQYTTYKKSPDIK